MHQQGDRLLLLGIETSCDETAAAVVKDGREVLSNVLYSQEQIHQKYGGVVPELACRQHTAVISDVVCAALDKARVELRDLSGIAVTQGPGLMGALLVGVSFGKALAYRHKLRLIGVNHLEGHIAAVHLENRTVELPAVALVVSGGHTNIYFVPAHGPLELAGQTIDDAAGEAFDKGAKMLGLAYPGGPAIDRISKTGDPTRINFPRPYLRNDSLDMSFSGLKTSLRYYLERSGFPHTGRGQISNLSPVSIPDVAAAFQQAIVDVLVEKTVLAADRYGARSVCVTGGVAANINLRQRLAEVCREGGRSLYIPNPSYCTDNGAMIAAAGYFRFHRERESPLLTLSPQTAPPMGGSWFTGI
ncbi:MAG: tRNA (adenosine(37)-N6)-threonylcarbamoyltransferase complex transferase subunit TsaD [Nitrospirae bacterium]|nr:tRNA (adenosine(37)-N6)-threonylcarbamoyltransferase complex transferase subunit TsaD [Nitrospirota bacterium]